MKAAAVALAAACAWSAPAHGQAVPGSASLSYEALAKSPKGSWAEYKMSVGAQGASTMRYSLVDKSDKSLTLEIETATPPLVMRMDFVANGRAAWKLSRIRMKLGAGEVQDVPLPEGGVDKLIKKGGDLGTLVGKETLHTPAGDFQCKHYKQSTTQGPGEVWMSDSALPSGLVQTVVPSLGARFTLAATGGGAVAKIP